MNHVTAPPPTAHSHGATFLRDGAADGGQIADLMFRALGVSDAPAEPSTVAIIMRTKNRPILLARALASVTGQTFPRWHLHVVNDGGDRDAVDRVVAAHLPALGDRVTIRHNADSLGMEAASNQALATADASCFTVHDDDDSWEPGFLAAATAFLEAPEHAALVGVVTGCTYVHERMEQNAIVVEQRVPRRDMPKVADLAELLVLNRAVPISIVFRMSLIERLGGFNSDLPVIGDWEFNMRALLTGEIGMIAAALANYHVRRTPPSAAYGNSQVDGVHRHIRYDRLLRNHVMRRALTAHPELLGVLQPLLHAISGAREHAMAHLNHVAATLADQQRQASATLLKEMLNQQAQHEEVIVARIIAELRAPRSADP